MDLLDIVIIAAAAVGVIAFITLAVVIVLQGRALKRLEERVGPPVPMGAAPSLERVRAIVSQPEVRVDIPADAAAAQRVRRNTPPAAEPAAGPTGASRPDAADAAASGAAATRAAERTGQRGKGSGKSSRPSSGGGPRKSSSSGSGGGNGALLALVAIVAIAVIAVGVWFLFLRGGDTSTPATAGTGTTATRTAGTTATAPDTASAVPTDVPPVANKAAYTVAVLNASGVSGAAANRVAPRVQAAGYTLGVVDNAAQQDLVTSVVQYVPGRKEVAWNVAKDLGITTAGPVDSLSQGRIGTADVVVIVGKDLSK